MTAFVQFLVTVATRHPLRVLALVGMLFAASLPGLFRLELATDARALVPSDAPEIVYDREVRAQYGVLDPLVILLHSNHPDGVFNPATLAHVQDLTDAFRQLKGVREANLLSLATESSFRMKPGTVHFHTLLDPLPETREASLAVGKDVESIALYDGILVSRDRASTALLVGVPTGEGASAGDRWTFYGKVRELIAAHDAPGDTVSIVGPPVAEARLGRQVLHDLGLTPWRPAGELGDPSLGVGLVPLAILVMLVVLLAVFRRWSAALLPLLEVGVCIAIVFGIMGWLGIPVYLTSTVLPVILTAVGVADEIHIFHHYRRLYHRRPGIGRIELVRAALAEMAPPVMKTSVTTAIGFLSFALSPLPPVRLFGLFAALGVLVSFLLSILLIPACLVLLPPSKWVRSPQPGRLEVAVERYFAHLARVAWRSRAAVLVVMVGVALAAGVATHFVIVQDSWIDAFDPASDFSRAMHHFDDQFLGSHQLLVNLEFEPQRWAGEVEAESVGDRQMRLPAAPGVDPQQLVHSWIRIDQPPGSRGRHWSSWIEGVRQQDGEIILTWPRQDGSPKFWLRPQAGTRLKFEIVTEPLMIPSRLQQVAALEEFLRRQPGVGGVLGPVSYLETTAFMIHPHREGSRRLPEQPDEVRTRWSQYASVRGPERLALLVDSESYGRGLLTVFLEGSNYRETARLVETLRDYEKQHPEGPHLRLAGDVQVSQTLIGGVVASQLQSLAFSLVGIFLAATVLGGSWRWGVACVLPPAWAVLLNFAVMGGSGIPLGIATSMFAGMSLGVGVDYAIHLIERLSREEAAGAGAEQRLVAALTAIGPAILIDALAVGLGFAVLTFSSVPGNARLGLLLVLSVAGCVLATLAVVPVFWAYVGGRRRAAAEVESN